LFVKMMPSICPNAQAFIAKPLRDKLRDTQGLKELFVQNFMENGINNTFIYFPLFYTLQEFLTKGWENARVSTALTK